MNDEADSSTAPLGLASSASTHRGRRDNRDEEDGSLTTLSSAELASRRKKNRDLFNRKRGDLLDDLLRNLDILVYAELSVIYYMDCSFLRFLFRAFFHFVSLTPKPAPFPEHPADRPALGGVVGSFLLCLICHIWFAPPSAGEVSRGYLHGGLAMDFIGQKGPVGKVELIGLDLLVLVLQIVQLAGGTARRRLRNAGEESSTSSVSESNTAQDLDAEERGVHRPTEQQQQQEEGEAIEMQNLNPTTSTATDTSPESSSAAETTLLTTTLPPNPADENLLFDAFSTGQIVLADLDIPRCVRDQLRMLRNPPARATGSALDGNRTFRGELAARVLRMRMGTEALRGSLST